MARKSQQDKESLLTQTNEKDPVRPDKEWLEHIKQEKSSFSHRIFTDYSYYLSFWQNSEHSIILIDESGSIIACNPHFCDLVDQTIGELKNKSFFDLIDKKHFKRDIVNIQEVIDSAIYSYSTESQIEKHHSNIIPVQLIATRIPATLSHPFRHIVVHLYELHDATIVRNPTYEKVKNGIYGWKELFLQPWFVKLAFVFLIILMVLITLSGHLIPVVDKLLEKWAR